QSTERRAGQEEPGVGAEAPDAPEILAPVPRLTDHDEDDQPGQGETHEPDQPRRGQALLGAVSVSAVGTRRAYPAQHTHRRSAERGKRSRQPDAHAPRLLASHRQGKTPSGEPGNDLLDPAIHLLEVVVEQTDHQVLEPGLAEIVDALDDLLSGSHEVALL